MIVETATSGASHLVSHHRERSVLRDRTGWSVPTITGLVGASLTPTGELALTGNTATFYVELGLGSHVLRLVSLSEDAYVQSEMAWVNPLPTDQNRVSVALADIVVGMMGGEPIYAQTLWAGGVLTNLVGDVGTQLPYSNYDRVVNISALPSADLSTAYYVNYPEVWQWIDPALIGSSNIRPSAANSGNLWRVGAMADAKAYFAVKDLSNADSLATRLEKFGQAMVDTTLMKARQDWITNVKGANYYPLFSDENSYHMDHGSRNRGWNAPGAFAQMSRRSDYVPAHVLSAEYRGIATQYSRYRTDGVAGRVALRVSTPLGKDVIGMLVRPA